MLNLISLLFITLSLNLDAIAQEPIITDKLIEIRFNHDTTQDDLDYIQSALNERNIDIVFTTIQFNKNGKLNSIAFEVDFNDGFSGSAANSLLSLTYVGFQRDYREGATTASRFGTF